MLCNNRNKKIYIYKNDHEISNNQEKILKNMIIIIEKIINLVGKILSNYKIINKPEYNELVY